MSRPATSPMARPDGRGAGEAHHVDVRRRDERLPGLGRRAGDHVDDAGGEARLVEDLAEHRDGERVLRRRLHHDGVAHRQRRADLAGHVHDREVVRRDARDDADGLAHDDGAHQPARGQRRGRHLARRERDGRRARARPSRSDGTARCRWAPAWCEATRWVAPVSACTSGMSSSIRSRSRSAGAVEQRGALLGLRAAPRRGRRRRPRPAAASTCATDASGASAITASVAGLTIS